MDSYCTGFKVSNQVITVLFFDKILVVYALYRHLFGNTFLYFTIDINGNIDALAGIAVHDFQLAQIFTSMERHEIAFCNRPPTICPKY